MSGKGSMCLPPLLKGDLGNKILHVDIQILLLRVGWSVEEEALSQEAS